MKKFSLLLLVLLVAFIAKSQDNFTVLLEQKSDDRELVKKLETFKENGIELDLDVDGIKYQQIIDTAKTYLETPHCMGGISHNCIDCSGLLYVSFKSVGVDVPHSSEDIARYGDIILDVDDLLPGDLVFFVKTYNTSKVITHAGIYLGDYEFIHTSASRGVTISNLKSNYYAEHYIFGTRVFIHKKEPILDSE
ncbi:MAG: C40 family peptidase [Bacteroidales bacterium]|nr:C40 family peptidase [Bacteroidales bacterium]